ncbi:MAG: transglutaminase family protein [Planctomycetes bacterium]|nr:transglutaminase family protein [Planctomycetota bacterium]
MSLNNDYNCDTEFVKLMARQTDVDLTTAALELSRDVTPNLDFRETFSWIDDRANEISGCVACSKTERDALQELGRCIAERQGIYGEKDCYERPQSSYLDRVIETKRGIPIALSLLYMAVGDRIGIELKGVAAPAHFLVRYESVEGPLFLDPFFRGRIFTFSECSQWLRNLTGLPDQAIESALQPVGPRKIIIRILNNLKTVYGNQKNWAAARTVQHRLATLEPASYRQRKDLAVISLKANRPGEAIDLLQSCLRSCANDEKQTLESLLDQAHNQVVRWN